MYFLIQYEKGTPMKKNLKILLFIAVCAIAGSGLLYVKEYSQKQQINSEKDEKETLVLMRNGMAKAVPFFYVSPF